MFRRFFVAVFMVMIPGVVFAVEEPITRREGFLQIWNSVLRPAFETREKPYADVPKGDRGFLEITYAKNRGLLGNVTNFNPDEPLKLGDAALWIFRTRNVADPDQMRSEHLSGLLERYPIVDASADLTQPVLAIELTRLVQTLEELRRTEETKVSLYGEDFRGEGTAFGETFNPDEFTAAHITFPHNTLVRVTNVENGKSVLVRVNDRGPFVPGRSMDLSVAAFLSIAERSRGVITARIERLGDINLVDPALRAAWEAQSSAVPTAPATVLVPREITEKVCDDFGRRFQQRLTREVRLIRGVPHSLKLGQTLTLRGTDFFVVRSVTFPDGTVSRLQQWISEDEHYELTPSQTGEYMFRLGTKSGRERLMQMKVIDC